MITNDQLATFGAAAYAILAFCVPWDADTIAGLSDIADRSGLDTNDKSQARELCARFQLDAADLGDDAPEILFDQPITVQRAAVRDAVIAWHDARDGDSNDDEHAAAAELITTLLDFAGMRLPTV
jgi:hypothetical protein